MCKDRSRDPGVSARDLSFLKEHFFTDESLQAAISRLKSGEPLAYIIGEWYFCGETYKVTPAVLIPRPDTEHLVYELTASLPANGCFADLCTGSGCIAVSTLCQRPDCTAVAVDISEEALAAAQENAVRNGVADRISFLRADILKEDPLGSGMFDFIVSNPPYIRSSVIPTLSEQVRREPVIALDGGEDGLTFYRRLRDFFLPHVKAGGRMVWEIGYDQGKILKEMYGCTIKKDYGGNDRVAVLPVPL